MGSCDGPAGPPRPCSLDKGMPPGGAAERRRRCRNTGSEPREPALDGAGREGGVDAVDLLWLEFDVGRPGVLLHMGDGGSLRDGERPGIADEEPQRYLARRRAVGGGDLP